MAASTYGTLVVINRNGQDGSRFPVKTTTCVIGRNEDSDVRIQLPTVSDQHCRLDVVNDGQIVLVNLSTASFTLLNGVPVTTSAIIGHRNLFTVGDRSFRWEFTKNSPYYSVAVDGPSNSTESPLIHNDTPSSKENTISRDSLGKNSVKKKKTTSPPNHGPKRPSALEAPHVRSHLWANEDLSPRKVSFGPSLSPEQFDLSLPSATPIKKGARPSSRRSSLPNYYGNPILTSKTSISKDSGSGSKDRSNSKNRKKSPKNASPNSKASVERSPIKSTTSDILRKPKKKIDKLTAKSLSPKSNVVRPKMVFTDSKKGKGIRRLSGMDNAVKIVAPSSLDSKKSAALRTIHAGKLKKKSKSPIGRRNSSSHKISQMPFKSADNKVPKGSRRNSSKSTSTSVSSSWSDGLPDDSPMLPNDLFVSPLNSSDRSIKTPSSAVKRYLMQTKPKRRSARTNDSLNMSGIAMLLESPATLKKRSQNKNAKTKISMSPISGDTYIEHLFKRSPRSDYSNVRGLKRLMRKSPEADFTDVRGVKRLLRSLPKSSYADVFGLKRLMRTPRKSPKANYMNVEDLDELFKEHSSTKRVKRSSSGSTEADATRKRNISGSVTPVRKLRLSEKMTGSAKLRKLSGTSSELGTTKTPGRRGRPPRTAAKTPNVQSPKSPSRSPAVRTLRSSVRKRIATPQNASSVKVTPRAGKIKTNVAREILKASPRISPTAVEKKSPSSSPAKKQRRVPSKKEKVVVARSPVVTRRSKRKESAEQIEETQKVAKKPGRRKAEKTVNDLSTNEDSVMATPLRYTWTTAEKSPEATVMRRSHRKLAKQSPETSSSPPKSVLRSGRKRQTDKNSSVEITSPRGRNLRRKAK